MDPRQSIGYITHIQPGPKCFRRFENGVLQVSPIRDRDKYLYERNVRKSGLLRLPAEIRNTIWEYALGGQPNTLCILSIFERKFAYFQTATFATGDLGTLIDSSSLLRVSRQIYSESALLPYTLNTLAFESSLAFFDYIDCGMIRHVQNIKLNIAIPDDLFHLSCMVPRQFRSVDLVIWRASDSLDENFLLMLIRARFVGKGVVVRFVEPYWE